MPETKFGTHGIGNSSDT